MIGLSFGLVLAGALGATLLHRSPDQGAVPAPRGGRATTVAAHFLARYVDGDGRVVRHDEGGDTVSEGQAYALLLAVGVRDRDTFDRVWDWTRDHLRRPDGLLSWHWRDGRVVDRESAADADLDVARALVLAGEAFDDPDLRDEGESVGDALMDRETVPASGGRLLLPGTWADHEPPYLVNPSYISPVATQVLQESTGDDRWRELEVGSRELVRKLTDGGRLPPDWAEVGADGAVRPARGPVGQPEVFGYEAARTVLRHAESCYPGDRRISAGTLDLLGGDDEAAQPVRGLAGQARSDWPDPLAYATRAASQAAAGREHEARRELDRAVEVGRTRPTYYGDAWAALGWMLLTEPSLGGCPPEVRT